MKTKHKKSSEEMLDEYDFSNGIRGKHSQQMQEGYTVTVFSPNQEAFKQNQREGINYIKIDKDNFEHFRTSEEINNALRSLISI